MQKCFMILMLSLICLSVICSTFAFTVSAAEYDLGSPSLWFTHYTGSSFSSPYYSFYTLYGDDSFYGYSESFRLLFYPNGYQLYPGFDNSYSLDLLRYPVGHDDIYPSYENAGFRYRATDIDIQKNVLAFVCGDNVRGDLIIPGIYYKDIMLPASDQYFKVQFSVDTVKLGTAYDIPDAFNPLLQPEYLCFFEVDGRPSNTEPSVFVPFSSVVVQPSNNGRVLTYTYYFNSSGDVFNSLREDNSSALINLVIRFPYYFGNSPELENGVFILSNYDFPVSYEIITPGGYSQELEGIQNAITVSNEKLIDYYDTISGEDQAVIVHAQQQNNKLDSAMDDFNQSDEVIKDIANSAVAPDVQGSASDAISNIDSSGIKKVFANPYIISLFTLVLGFGFLRLILYGTKEG